MNRIAIVTLATFVISSLGCTTVGVGEEKDGDLDSGVKNRWQVIPGPGTLDLDGNIRLDGWWINSGENPAYPVRIKTTDGNSNTAFRFANDYIGNGADNDHLIFYKWTTQSGFQEKQELFWRKPPSAGEDFFYIDEDEGTIDNILTFSLGAEWNGSSFDGTLQANNNEQRASERNISLTPFIDLRDSAQPKKLDKDNVLFIEEVGSTAQFYSIQLLTSKTITIATSFQSGADTWLFLFDSKNLLDQNDKAEDTSAQDNIFARSDSYLHLSLGAGTYYVMVSTYKTTEDDEQGQANANAKANNNIILSTPHTDS